MLLYDMNRLKQLSNTLEEKLGLKVYVSKNLDDSLVFPLALKHQYQLYRLIIEGISFLGVYVESIEINAFKKHLKIFEEKTEMPLVLMIENLSASGRKYLIKNRISFVSDTVIYMPRLLIYLDDAVATKLTQAKHKKFSKLAQQLIITLLATQTQQADTQYVMQQFGVSKMSASRVLNELELSGFLSLHQQGRQKRYTLHVDEIDELLAKMRNPVMQVIYMDSKDIHHSGDAVYISGHNALSHYTNITAQLQTVAVEKKRFDSHVQPFTTYDAAYEQDFVKVELWRYAPIGHKDAVDPFSLYASLQESTEDERTHHAMNELYRTLKRMVDDTRY